MKDYIFRDMAIYHTCYDESIYNQDLKSEKTIKLLESYTEDEKDEYYHYLIGRNAFFDKDYKLSLTHLNYASTDSPKISEKKNYIFLLKVASLRHLSLYDDAIKQSTSYLNQNPEFKDLYYFLALSYLYKGVFSEALKYLLRYKNTPVDNALYPTLVNVPPDKLNSIIKYTVGEMKKI